MIVALRLRSQGTRMSAGGAADPQGPESNFVQQINSIELRLAEFRPQKQLTPRV